MILQGEGIVAATTLFLMPEGELLLRLRGESERIGGIGFVFGSVLDSVGDNVV